MIISYILLCSIIYFFLRVLTAFHSYREVFIYFGLKFIFSHKYLIWIFVILLLSLYKTISTTKIEMNRWYIELLLEFVISLCS